MATSFTHFHGLDLQTLIGRYLRSFIYHLRSSPLLSTHVLQSRVFPRLGMLIGNYPIEVLLAIRHNRVLRLSLSMPGLFQTFPPEIRNKISRELLTNKDHAVEFQRRLSGGETSNHLHPNILRACKQAYLEGSPVLYGNNVFLFSCGTNYIPPRGSP